MANFIFTGFKPFGTIEYNPSWTVAVAAASELEAQAHLLDVDFETAASVGEELLRDDMIVVHVGVAASRTTVDFERFAHNATGDYESVSAGVGTLESGGPAARLTQMPLARFVENWGVSVLATESRDAGVFVCNATYYHSLGAAEVFRDCHVVFVHVPLLDEDGAREVGRELARVLALEYEA